MEDSFALRPYSRLRSALDARDDRLGEGQGLTPARRPFVSVTATSTIAVMTDLWPSASQPYAGSFVRVQASAYDQTLRPVVLVPRLVARRLHATVWGDAVEGWQRGWLDAPNGRVIAYPLARLPKIGEATARALSARAMLALSREQPRLVHGHFLLNVGPAAVRLADRLHVPVVLTAHGTDVRWLADGDLPSRLHREMLTACERADRVIVVAESMRETLVGLGLDRFKIVVIPMGVDDSVFAAGDMALARVRLGQPADGSIVMFVGRAVREKGSDVLSEALVELRRRGRAFRCLHAGPTIDPLPRCEELGVLTPHELAGYVTAADVLCLPSYAEGSPVSVAEALAVGTPVVASNVGGIPQQVHDGENGFLVPPGNSMLLADALERALDRQWDRAAIAAAGRRFSAASAAVRLAAVYKELLD
jgi:glycosyltransferase involved in cell wall biosynthesis